MCNGTVRLNYSWGLFVAIFILATSVAVLVWSTLPSKSVEAELPVKIEGQWLDACLIKLAWTPLVRTGDDIKISFLFEDNGTHLCQTELADQYPEDNLLIEARLDFPGLQVIPQDTFIEPLSNGSDMQFLWYVSSSSVGIKEGTLWVFINTVHKQNGSRGQYPIIARGIEVESRSIFGLNAPLMRICSLLGIITGVYLSVRNFRMISL
jgi:hypothetical protein